MIIINSGAYVDAEFQAEVGRLPPALLPLGNKRLYETQIRCLRAHFPDPIFLSLPESFSLPPQDARALTHLGIEVVPVPDGLKLGEAVLYVINTLGIYGEPVKLLHGDTLLDRFPLEADVIGVAPSADQYDWQVEKSEATEDLVWCGFFGFASAGELARSLASSRGNFVEAVKRYDERRPLSRVGCDSWLDFGHINTYFKSRSTVTTQRIFNSLAIQDGVVRKTGEQADKIAAEAAWFAGLPPTIRRYAPQLIDRGQDADGRAFYILEYLCMLPLNELYVHGKNSTAFWSRIFDRAKSLLERLAAIELTEEARQAAASDAPRMLAGKTQERLERFARMRGFDLDRPLSLNGTALPPIAEIVHQCLAASAAIPVQPGVVHGDLCFSNMLFDTRGDDLKLVDPRGLDSQGRPTNLGDLRYDLAKLSHSVIGLYDFILAGAYQASSDGAGGFTLSIEIDERLQAVQALFLEKPMLGTLTPRQVMPMTVLLFLSMLPLHEEDADRQDALLAKGLDLYQRHVSPCS